MNIRKANLNDLDTICDLNNQLFKLEKEKYDPTLVEGWPISNEGREYFTDLINNHYVIVAIQDNNVVGYLAGSIEEKGSYELIQYGEINNMLVSDSCRGKGIGKLLIDNFKVYCKEHSIYNIKVVASYKNENAINFYHKNGFEDFNLTLTMNID